MAYDSYDCVIAGGGPAGALCAATLAGWGRRVQLVQEASSAHKPPAETLVPAALRSFERYGLAQVLCRPEFEGSARHGAIWGSSELHWREVGKGERGYRIDRSQFDRALRDFATERGVTLLEGWRVEQPFDGEGPWTLLGPGGKRETVQATLRIATCGRPRREPRSSGDRAIETCALWSVIEAGSEYHDATLVEAVAEGWFWWLPLEDGRVCLSLFADLEQVKQCGPEELFRAALSGSIGPGREARPGRVRGMVCSPGLRKPRGDLILAGDAAANIDPLSSQGVEKALASGLDAAFAANTWIESPEMGDSLRDHRWRWESQLFHAHARETSAFYAREKRFSEAPFWRKRHAAPALEAESTGPELEPPEFIQVHPELVTTSALVRGERIFKTCTAFRAAAGDQVLHHLGPLDLAALFELLPASREELLERARVLPSFAGLTPRMLLGSLTELVRLGFLSPATRPASDSRGTR